MPARPAGWKQAWDLRPPVQGDVDYDDFRRLTPAMIEYQQALIDASDRAPELAALDDVDVPEVPLAEQRRLAEMIAAGVGPRDKEDGSPGPVTLPSPADPMAVARVLLERYVVEGSLTLRRWRGGWWRWHRSHWVECEVSAIRKACYAFTEHAS